MKKQLKSFAFAFRGIACALCSEGHLRFHFVAAFYVLLFSGFYHLSQAQTALLVLQIASVIAAELFNTAIENVCDLITTGKNEHIRIAKDVSAGAVLVLSAAAVVTAVIFFLDFEVIGSIVAFFGARIPLLVLLAVSVVVSVLFVWMPKGIVRKLRKNERD